MNQMTKAVLYFGGLCFFSSQLCADQLDVSLNPSVMSFASGQMFTADIDADISSPIIGFGIDFGFDSTVLTLDSFAVGSLWFAAMGSEPNDIAGLAFPTPVSGADVLLATLDFTAMAAGTPSSVSVFYNSENLAEGFPLAAGGFATANIPDESAMLATPEPSSLFLLLTGLLLGSLYQWRQRR